MLFLLLFCGFIIKLRNPRFSPKSPKLKRLSGFLVVFGKNRERKAINKTKNLFKKTTKNKKTVDKGRVIYYNVIKDAGVYPFIATVEKVA